MTDEIVAPVPRDLPDVHKETGKHGLRAAARQENEES
jgi:hypothetical protein